MTPEEIKEKLIKVAEISLTPEPEYIPVRGNAMSSGDDEVDKAEEDRILADLERNECAWCCMHVQARYLGLTGDTYLGACSYDSLSDFRDNSGYYADMVDEAITKIANQILKIQSFAKESLDV